MNSYTMNHTKDLPHDLRLEELMTEYGDQILKLVMHYVHNTTIAEDLTQEIFVKCYQALPSFQFQSSIKTWLWRIAINHTKDYLKSWYARKVNAAEETIFHKAATTTTVEQHIIQQQEDVALAQAVLNLPLKYREVIYLCYYEEQSMKEIADILQLNENTVKSRLRLAKERLKKQLECE